MKLSFKKITAKELRFKFHLQTDEEELQSVLNIIIDTLMGFGGETVFESLKTHEKNFKGKIWPSHFEFIPKYQALAFETYNPRVIRGEIQPVGSNYEMFLIATKKQQSSNAILIALSFIILILTIFKDNPSHIDYVMIGICSLFLILYYLVSNWFQFIVMSRFIKEMNTRITLWQIPDENR